MVPLGDNISSAFQAWNCSNCSRAANPELDVTKAVVLGLVLGVFVVFGVLGNVLVILSVTCHRHLHTVTHCFIANLAVADLLLSTTVLPLSAAFEICGHWPFGRPLCSAWAALDVLCCTASILSLCAISVDRCLGISYPLRYPALMTPRRGLLALAMLWLLAAAISVGPLLGWREPMPTDESVCPVNQEPAYVIFSAVGSFYLPLAVILVMYCRVYIVARGEIRDLREGRKTNLSNPGQVTLRIHRGPSSTVAVEVGRGQVEHLRGRTPLTLRLLKFSQEKKAAKTLGIVVGCFVLCWLPFFLVLPIGSIFPSYRPSDTVFKVTFWLGYFNSCINPVIYPCSSKEFQRAFRNVLHLRCHGSPARLTRQPCPGPDRRAPARLSLCAQTSPLFQASPIKSRLRSKSLLRVFCGTAGPTAPEEGTLPPFHSGPPKAKIHHLSLGEAGEAV
ncbi:alpha-1A adrenergic receptor-like [Paramormyrops kingsleyae]|uniref:Alpha-1A adrenergic receptor n=1 Tax=Paramormyrops kingsleyae TaxID=1676925 RepID=A0A3B3QMT8_9TELE|nr:alpha-1A adrenergic receptor-like [Paramormyrops kingsleyae]XP_023654429.1 alpha-1A adrenergic receptor-like [Paramormyrops kingsleyae]